MLRTCDTVSREGERQGEICLVNDVTHTHTRKHTHTAWTASFFAPSLPKMYSTTMHFLAAFEVNFLRVTPPASPAVAQPAKATSAALSDALSVSCASLRCVYVSVLQMCQKFCVSGGVLGG